MYRILSTNSESLNARNIDLKKGSIDIIALESELQEFKRTGKEPKLYAYRWGQFYDENDNFSSNIKGKQAIKGELLEEYFLQKNDARAALEKIKKELLAETNNNELQTLRKSWDAQKTMINELRNELETAKQNKNSSGEMANIIDIIKSQSKMIEELKAVKNNRIEIKIGEKNTQVVEKIVHEKFSTILRLLAKKQALYCYGPAGTGKSEMAKQLAETMGLEFYPMSTLTQEFKLSGFIDGNGHYHETNFYRAFKFGGLFFLDEMDSSVEDVLVGINGALANGYYDFPTGTVKAHTDFYVISAGNTIGRGANMDYTGRNALDLSTLDRFWGVKIDYSPKIDMAVANNDKELFDFAQALRKASKDTEISILMSYRSIARLANFQDDFELSEIMDMAVTKGMAKDDIIMLYRNMNISKNNKYYKALVESVA